MPKPSKYPILYDAVKKISISFLAAHGYLKQNQIQSGVITWSRHGTVTGRLTITVKMLPNENFVELNYLCNDTPVQYTVQLISCPSNLGKGVVWYFLCPITGKRCRKLYLIDTHFYNRSAFSRCFYDCQIQSKRYRELDKTLGAYYRVDELYQQLYKKHFKKQYAGKPTKRYLKLTALIANATRLTDSQIIALEASLMQ